MRLCNLKGMEPSNQDPRIEHTGALQVREPNRGVCCIAESVETTDSQYITEKPIQV
jgi:hypothetical protein